jgi:hypothetical protein
MSYTSNKKAFLNPTAPDSLFSAYCILVAIELALKDASVPAPNGGHDVPTMLQLAAAATPASPAVTGQLLALSARLKTDLGAITCEGKKGLPTAVPPHSYPHLRYSRQVGDWAGISETPISSMLALESTCNSLKAFLGVHSAALGVLL